MNLILFDDPAVRNHLLPFTYTRPVAEIRCGILTLTEKWARYFNGAPSFQTEEYLSAKYPASLSNDNLFLNGCVLPDAELVASVRKLAKGQCLTSGGRILAARTERGHPSAAGLSEVVFPGNVRCIDRTWKIFQLNGEELRRDFDLITKGRKSEAVTDPHTKTYNPSQIFLEPGVTLHAAVLNAENGPIYLGRNTIVQEGAMIRGPFALGEGSHVNMGAKMRGDVSIGPYSKMGGEVSATVVFGYSNKAHDGFMGCSVIGEWCNFGADSNTSNLKNNYESIRLYDFSTERFEDTGLMFCGLMMGDHAKCGINTMFNTGSVVGVSANVFGAGYLRNYIPSFGWGGTGGLTTFKLDKALEAGSKAMERRNRKMDAVETGILNEVYRMTSAHRTWEKHP